MSKTKFTTPKGVAIYPWLQPNRPDTAFDPEGKYKVQLKMSEAEGKPLMELIKQVKADNFAAKDKVHLPFSTDDETGEIIFKLQSKYKPKYVDSSGSPIPEENVPLMFGGSELKAKGMLDPYSGSSKGISMRLSAVQVINPVSGDGGDSFDAVDGGYTINSAQGAANGSKEEDDEDFDF